MEFIIALRER